MPMHFQRPTALPHVDERTAGSLANPWAFWAPTGKYILSYTLKKIRGLAGWKGFEPLADGLRVHRS
ncbi:MAG: hypothetical protein K8R17_05320, partial [Methanosarcinales archaeon]|nr:hypothetical protein [Methanosarcinales archaeon]